MTHLNIKVTVDADEAIAALDALVAAANRAEKALAGLTAAVITDDAVTRNAVSARDMAERVRADLQASAISNVNARIVADNITAGKFSLHTPPLL